MPVGQPEKITVTVAHAGSGSSMNNILEGKIQPIVWSPGGDLWVTSINQAWQDRTGGRLINAECPAMLRLPLTIAIWQPMAEALGWPDAPIGSAAIGHGGQRRQNLYHRPRRRRRHGRAGDPGQPHERQAVQRRRGGY